MPPVQPQAGHTVGDGQGQLSLSPSEILSHLDLFPRGSLCYNYLVYVSRDSLCIYKSLWIFTYTHWFFCPHRMVTYSTYSVWFAFFKMSWHNVEIIPCQQVVLLHPRLHNCPTSSLHLEVAWVPSTCGHLSYLLFDVAVVLFAVRDRYACWHVHSGISGTPREVLCSVKGNRH